MEYRAFFIGKGIHFFLPMEVPAEVVAVVARGRLEWANAEPFRVVDGPTTSLEAHAYEMLGSHYCRLRYDSLFHLCKASLLL